MRLAVRLARPESPLKRNKLTFGPCRYLATSYAKVSASVLGGNALFRATFAAALP